MDYAALSDPLLRTALWAGLGAVLVSMLLLVYIVVLRLTLIERHRRDQRFMATWRPIMLATIAHEPVILPVLTKPERHAFLKLWNHFQESLRGEARSRLNDLALQCRIGEVVRPMLRERSVRDRLIAIFTLGHLHDHAAWQDLVTLAADPHPLLSICAARALLQIDSARALHVLMPAFIARGDWSVAKVTAMLSEAGADAISLPLVNAVTTLTAIAKEDETTFKLARLLQFLDAAHTEQAAEAILHVLEVATDHGIIAACLRALRDPRGLEFVRAYVSHPIWFVRIQAARALGRLGGHQDRERLVALLSDPVWWVRYRAAQAIVALPMTTRGELENMRAALKDRFAADILKQAIAEGDAG